MTVSSVTKGLFYLVGLLLTLSLLSCTPAPPSPPTPPKDPTESAPAPAPVISVEGQAVGARAMARWEALIRRDLAAAYGFSTPEFRARIPLQAFTSRFGNDILWEQAQVDSVEMQEGNKAKVVMNVVYRPVSDVGEIRGVRGAGITETWVKSEGSWWVDLPD